MHIWLLVIGALFVQESISASLVILDAYRAGYSPILITMLWFSIALLEITVGFFVGTFIKQRYSHTGFEKWIEARIATVTETIGIQSEEVLLIALAFLSPFVAGIVSSWITTRLRKILIFCMIGDFIWYIWVWLRVLGVNEFASSFKEAAWILFAVGILFAVIVSTIKRRNIRNK
jgi:hypothetical protein